MDDESEIMSEEDDNEFDDFLKDLDGFESD